MTHGQSGFVQILLWFKNSTILWSYKYSVTLIMDHSFSYFLWDNNVNLRYRHFQTWYFSSFPWLWEYSWSLFIKLNLGKIEICTSQKLPYSPPFYILHFKLQIPSPLYPSPCRNTQDHSDTVLKPGFFWEAHGFQISFTPNTLSSSNPILRSHSIINKIF